MTALHELIGIVLCVVGCTFMLFCIGYTVQSVWTRLDGKREADRKRLESYDLTFPETFRQLEVLKNENAWLRDQLTVTQNRLAQYRRHPAFQVAQEQLKRRRRRCMCNDERTQEETPVPIHNTTPSSQRGGDDE